MAKDNEITHWADKIVEEVKEKVANNPDLQKMVKEKGYIVYDEKTPSGEIHIGSGRGWVIHDVIAKAMRDAGLKAKFVLSSDDIDPFDKWNANLDPKFKKYLGVPFRYIPSPVEGYKNFGDYYFTKATEKFKEFGIEAELELTGELYERGDFNKTIKIALDNADKIQQIYIDLYGDDVDAAKKLPFNPLCEKCGKIATTETYEWDKKREVVKYRCRKDLVDWAEGCGYEGERSPYNGGGKMPWKVEWAAKWPTVGVVCETAGKDHFTKLGSRDVSIRIADKVFDIEPPWPSTRKFMGKGYEFFMVGGRKMSTSKGTGISFAESTEIAPAKILRYLLVRTRPHSALDFNPSNRNDLILLFDRYDTTERIYFGKEPDVSETEEKKQKRIYELSYIGTIPKKMPLQVPFSHCAIVIQAAGHDAEKAVDLLKLTSHVPEKASKDDIEYVKERLVAAKKWVEEFAPEQYVFKVNEKVEYKLKNDKEKKAVNLVAEALDKDWTDKELHNHFYEICEQAGLDPKEFFEMMYQIIVGKERGPKLALFILTLGTDKVLDLLKQAM